MRQLRLALDLVEQRVELLVGEPANSLQLEVAAMRGGRIGGSGLRGAFS